MSAVEQPGIELFVEGSEDELFVSRVFVPRLESHYLYVNIHQYAEQLEERLHKHFRSLVRMSERFPTHFFFLVDCEAGRCIRDVRSATAHEWRPHLKESQILVVRPEIEAWYCAGLPNPNPLKVEIPADVDRVDKETFNRMFGERATDRLKRHLLLAEILSLYDWQLALQRSASLRYCAQKLGI